MKSFTERALIPLFVVLVLVVGPVAVSAVLAPSEQAPILRCVKAIPIAVAIDGMLETSLVLVNNGTTQITIQYLDFADNMFPELNKHVEINVVLTPGHIWSMRLSDLVGHGGVFGIANITFTGQKNPNLYAYFNVVDYSPFTQQFIEMKDVTCRDNTAR
jgi:hypothetical protein